MYYGTYHMLFAIEPSLNYYFEGSHWMKYLIWENDTWKPKWVSNCEENWEVFSIDKGKTMNSYCMECQRSNTLSSWWSSNIVSIKLWHEKWMLTYPPGSCSSHLNFVIWLMRMIGNNKFSTSKLILWSGKIKDNLKSKFVRISPIVRYWTQDFFFWS